MKRLLAIVSMAMLLVVVGASSALAADFEIPVNTVVKAAPGSMTLLADEITPDELVGSTCISVAVGFNPDSVHPNNNIIIRSADSEIVLPDVEGEPAKTTDSIGDLTLGPDVQVWLEMGSDGVFSAGLTILIDANCSFPQPAIEIEKTATPETYGEDGIGHFTIVVTNPGPTDLTDVHVTDDIAVAIDPSTNCVNNSIGDLAVGGSFTYECQVANLDGVSPWTNEATSIGTGPRGTQVTATDDATVFPPVLPTTITTPPTTQPPTTVAPTTVPPSTLPVTGVEADQVRGFGFAGIALLALGVALLGGAAAIGHYRQDN